MLIPHNNVMDLNNVMFVLYELFVSLTPTSLVKSFRGEEHEEEEQFKKCNWKLCQLGKNCSHHVLRPNPSQELLTTYLSSG